MGKRIYVFIRQLKTDHTEIKCSTLVYIFGSNISDHIFCCIDHSDNKEEML